MFEGYERIDLDGLNRMTIIHRATGRVWEDIVSSAMTPRFRELLQGEGWRRNFVTDMMRRGSSRQWRRTLQTHLETFRADRPPASSRQELDPNDVEFVMEFTHVTHRRAEAYLRFFRDPVETVMCLMHPCDDDPIPDFQERERPPLAEPYVSRYTGNRNPHGTDYRDGYESA
jgi:hypothetical protein